MYHKISPIDLRAMQGAVSPAVGAALEQVLCQAAFDSVADKNDWRNPIDASIPAHGMFTDEFIAYAVEYMTATKPSLTWENGRGMVIRSIGYRNGPAGP